MFSASACLALVALMHMAQGQLELTVTVDLKNYNYTTDLEFCSVAVGTRTLQRTTRGSRPQFPVRNPTFETFTRALAPLTVRVGGSYANFLIFNNGVDAPVPPEVEAEWVDCFGGPFWEKKVNKWKNANYTAAQWHVLLNYTNTVGWKVLFDVNHLLQRDGYWDPTNFRMLMNYTRDNNLKIGGFQLGNEPNSYNFKYKFGRSASQLAQEYGTMRRILQEEYPAYANVELVGPEITSLARSFSAPPFLEQFLRAGAAHYIDAIGLHHYYMNGRGATVDNFLDTTMFDQFKVLTDRATQIRDRYAPGLPITMTETTSAYGGGAPDLSNRFVSGFLYLDAMGLAAKAGFKRFHRQTFNSANYALIDKNTMEPHPDYYVALLFKRLILGPVLDVTLEPNDNNFRIYAHCARRDIYDINQPGVVLYYVNLHAEDVTLDLNATFPSRELSLFILTPASADPDKNILQSRTVKLNGEVLQMNGTELPTIEPVLHPGGSVTVPRHSLGFIGIKRGRSKACKDWHVEQ